MLDRKLAPPAVNSRDYWEDRFRTDWVAAGGRDQSRIFMDLLVKYLPAAVYEEMTEHGLSLLDCGCAAGDGVDVLARSFPRSSVAGFDFSAAAVEAAREGYPQLDFYVADFDEPGRTADVLISSNCFEHLERPLTALTGLLRHARRFVILLVPYLETVPTLSEHVRVIHDATFPLRHEGWRLTYRILVPPSPAWRDHQALLVFEPARLVPEDWPPPAPLRDWIAPPTVQGADRSGAVGDALVDIAHDLRRLYGEFKTHRARTETLARELGAAVALADERAAAVARLEAEKAELGRALAERRQRLSASGWKRARAERKHAKAERRLAAAAREHREIERVLAATANRLQANEAERDELARQIATLRAELGAVHSLRLWRLAHLYWTLRRGLRRPLQALVERLQRLERTSPTSLPAHYFLRFRADRDHTYGFDFEGVRPPVEPGLVSIVLPVYNGARVVAEALASLLGQSYQRFEVIAIDDGSTDGTTAILEDYARRDRRIRVVRQENRRIPRTLSRGFRLARGELVAWTSDDNRLRPEFLERMVDCLRRHPDWDLVYGNLSMIGPDGEPLRASSWYGAYQVPPGSEHVHLPTDPAELNVVANNYVGAAFLYRSRVPWLLGDYSPLRFTTEDYDYWMRVNSTMTLRHADFADPLYEYRFHPHSLTARDEELGITRDRVKLMVFEDFRRDFLMVPMAWSLDAGESAPARRLAAVLRRRIAAAGHVTWSPGAVDAGRLPRRTLPLVHLRIVAAAAAGGAPPAGADGALRVLVVTAAGGIDAAVDAGWDLCIVMAGAPVESRLGDGYRGWLAVSDGGTLFRALDVRAKSECLARMERAIEAAAEPRAAAAPRVSVVICTCRGGARLENALRAVASQRSVQGGVEVLVVNNRPADATLRAEIEALHATLFDGDPARFRWLACPVLGLSHARNAALWEAQGEFVCFLDDDAVPRPDWLQQTCRAFEEHPRAGVVGGHILLAPPAPRPRALVAGWESFWSQFVSPYEEYAPSRWWGDFPWGANWSARRKALLEVGGFRCRYGRRGNDFSGGEELVAAALALQLGYEVGIAPRAVVSHDVAKERYTFRHVRRTIIASTLVIYRMQRDLYLGMEGGAAETLRDLWRGPTLPDRLDDRLCRVLHRCFRREALLRLLFEQLRDLRRRRRPNG